MIFQDRADAGLQLAGELHRLKPQEPVVLALPRGGVPVGFEIAKSLEAPLDLVPVRKVGAPHQPELALGAVVDGGRMEIVLNDDVLAALGISEEYVRRRAEREVRDLLARPTARQPQTPEREPA